MKEVLMSQQLKQKKNGAVKPRQDQTAQAEPEKLIDEKHKSQYDYFGLKNATEDDGKTPTENKNPEEETFVQRPVYPELDQFGGYWSYNFPVISYSNNNQQVQAA